eukprot:882280_1
MNPTAEAIASARRFQRLVSILSCSPALGLITYIGYVKWKLHKSTHRPFTPSDMYHIRTMDGSTPGIMHNPGIRIESDFLTPQEQERLRFESKMMLSLYGYSTIPFWTRPNWNKQISGLLSQTRVNAIKVTGRDQNKALKEIPMTDHAKSLREEQEAAIIKTKPYETNEQRPAPWKSAHSFEYSALPKIYQDLVEKIKQLPDYKLGTVRDFSIDYREDRYFKFDPHVTPGLDGENVFMIALESDGVITLVPPEKEVYRRASMDDIARFSYTDKDLDILHRRGDLLCLSDTARTKYNWSIRLGIDGNTKGLKHLLKKKYVSKDVQNEEEQSEDSYWMTESDDLYGSVIVGNEDVVQNMPQDEDEYILCDWWGTSKQIIPRNKDKVIITITFGRPT